MGQFSALGHLPLVSVVIPAYNAEPFIARTLKSVLAQTYDPVEVLVVDDGSSDHTATIVKQFAQTDSRVRLFTQPNLGVAAARNLGVQQAKGDFIAPIDADDLWDAETIAKQMDCFLKSPSTVGLVYAWSLDVDEQDLPTGGFHAARVAGQVYPTLLCHNFLGNASCTLMRRSCLMAVGGYNEQMRAQQAQGCEDWDLYLRIAEQYEFRLVPEFLVGYRKLRHSMSHNYDRMARSHALMLQTAQKRHPSRPALYRLSRSSLYLYFAHQSNCDGDYACMRHWLMEAIRADITPWLRLGTYQLLLKSWLMLRQAGYFASHPSSKHTDAKPTDAKPSIFGLESMTPSPLQVIFKVVVGNVLHYSLALLGAR